jgi:hypothetical protein
LASREPPSLQSPCQQNLEQRESEKSNHLEKRKYVRRGGVKRQLYLCLPSKAMTLAKVSFPDFLATDDWTILSIDSFDSFYLLVLMY